MANTLQQFIIEDGQSCSTCGGISAVVDRVGAMLDIKPASGEDVLLLAVWKVQAAKRLPQ